MANNDKISKMYNALVKSGYNMASEEVFRQRMNDPNKRKAAYDALKKSGYNMRPYDEFEANIGYGEPAPAPAQASAPPVSTQQSPAPATTPETASAPAQQKRWQPTEQEKIQMSYRLHTMMNDFNQRSRARVEQTRRMTERMTPEGRKKLKAAKFAAQLAGTPTKVMGLTPNVSAAPADGQQGATDGAEAPKPLLSGQSPVPYGVVIENGERKTQWLLPDGSLTTDLIEADKAEYGARRVRLMNQFVGRMKANGLDPAKQEDVQRQAQLDYEAPMRKVLNSVWAQAEAEDRAADEDYRRELEEYNKSFRSNIRAFGPDGMPLPTAEENLRDYNRAVKRKETFNLESMANTIFNNLPSSYRQQSLYNYQQYFTAHTNELNGRSVQRAAEDALRAEVYNAVYQRAVDYQMPKSKTEFLMRKIADQPLLSPYMAMDMAAASMTHSWGMNAAEIDAMGQYGQQHRALDITGTVLNMAFDPTTYVSGGVGGFVGKQGMKLAAKQMIKGASKELAERYAARTLTGRVIGGVAGGAANFATYETLKNIQGQMAVGGVVNPETGEREFSFDEVLKAGGHGLVLGGVTGAFSPIIGNVADKYVKATTSTAGKMAVRTGELATSTLAEGTIFSAYDIYENSKLADDDPNKRSNWDIWSDSMAMMLGFKVSHMVKSAPQYVASLRPIKPTNGRPLTQAERNHNRMDFEERLRKRMDMSPRDLDFTKEERDELRRAGYGELADLFSRDHFETQNPNVNPADGAVELRTERVEAETIHRSPEFDGYSAMEALMQDSRVSQNARAKAYFILTGRMLPMGTVMAYNTQQAEDGSFIVNSVTSDGEVVTSRRFASEREAQGEIDNINRQVELNTIDVGERYRDAEANEAVFMAAVNEVSRGADPQAIRQIYEAVKRGDENVTESQRQLAEFLDEAIKRNAEAGAEHRPEAIRDRLNKETGLDVDKALRKQPKDRTKEEQALVERYARELFPEQKQEEQYEPSPEQAEADRMYEESRLLYGRFEQGDPTAQADIDAIAIRMQEAYQMCEDAFGAEAEYWMYHVNENPWSLINDPSLTPDQQEAVLYYINSKAALDGVMDASHEASQRKREQVEQEVAGRTHKERGVIIPAVMKVDDKPAYIIKGDVAMYTDGSGIDAAHSSESIVIMDESGEYKFVSPDQIYKVGESIDPQDELQTAYAQIDAEQESVFGVDVPPEPEAPAEPAPEPAAPAPEAEAPQQPIADTKEYDRGFEEGIEVSTSLSDEVLNQTINDLRGRDFLTDEWRGRLEAYEYEQQRRQMEAQNAPAEAAGNNNTENIPQNGNIGAENISAPEQQAETALSRIPFNEEKQDYEFTAVEPETAWDGLVEAMEGEANAVPIAQQMIEDANKRLEALGKKPPTPAKPKLAGKAGPMAMRAEQKRVDEANAKAQAEYQQALADAQAEAQAWSNILRVYTDRNAELRRQQEEERRRRDAEAHDAAVTRFEEEQRIKAEKQAEQERIGVHAVNPKIRERWEVAPKVEGNEDALTLPDGSTITGRYVLTEAGAASPSHDANNAYAPTEGFPIDENGQSVNDRDYQRDKDAQRIVENIAGSYDNRALQDPVIVSKDGVVLSGNNRTMSGDLAARQGTDKAYNDYLAKFGHKKFGFTPEQVQGMKNPRVVFVPDEALPYDATTFARFNAQEKKSQGKPEAAVKLGKIVPDAVFNNIVNDISRYDRLSDYYADEKAVAQALGALMQAGVINDKQMPELRTGTALSAGGKELLENTLIGKVFQASPDAVRQIISVPTLRQSIVMGLSEIANNRILSRNGYDLADELAKAVDLVQRAKSSNPDIYVEGMPVSPFGRQAGLFDDEFGDSRVTDATTLLLADILNSGKPSDLRKVLATYNNEASMSASGQADIFTGEIASKEDILTQVNEHFRNVTPKEQQALVDNAIAERKRRAAEEQQQRGGGEAGEQTADALQRGAEPQSVAEPTEAQKAAGNYKMEHRRVDGYNVSIENHKGSVRRGKTVDAEGKETPWETTMQNDYGYIRGTQGVDGDHIDVFLSDTPEQGDVFVIDQLDKYGNFDEHKVMYGFPSVEAAREAYLSNYEPGWTGLGAITHVSKDEFKKWIGSSKRKTKPFVEYKSVKVYREQNPQLTIEPDGFSDFGPVFTQFKGDAQGAIKLLSELQDGEAIGALHHKDIGDIDLVWGNAGTAKSDGFGLAKLVKFHPEVVKHLQEILDDMHIVNRSENRINLESDIHKAAVRLTWNREKKKWLLTAFEKKETPKSIDKTTDTGDNPTDLRGGTALSQNSGVSDGKVNTLSADKQTDGAESSEPYTITPAVYVGKPRGNKPGKETPMHRVTFNRPLTAEQERAVKAFANEAIGEKKGRFATKRGWADREASDGSWLFRTEEDARKAGELIGNEEAVADAQPLSREDIKQAAMPADKPARKKPAPKPANTVTVEDMTDESFNDDEVVDALVNHPMFKNTVDNNPDIDAAREMVKKVMDTLRTSYRRDEAFGQKGVNTYLRLTRDTELQKRLEDAAFAKRKPYSPAEPKSEPAPKGQFKVTDEMKAQEDELRKLLGIDDDEGSTDSYFRDPDELTPAQKRKVYSLGVDYAFNFLDNGVTSFPDFAKAVVGRLGSKVKPFIKSWYEGAKRVPGYGGEGYTDTAEVDRFDIENFDKPSPDAIRDAEMRVAERKAKEAAEQAERELIAERNEQRKKDEQQTATNTAALAEKAEAVASEAEKHASLAGGRKPKRKTILRDLKQIDDTLDEVNSQLALLGYYEADLDAPEHEVYGLRRSAEKKAVKDAVNLAKQLVDDLGIELDKVTGKTTEQQQKSRGKNDSAVRANVAPIGGDIVINLPYPDGRNLHINIGLSPTHERGVEPNRGGGAWEGDNYEVDRIMFRFEGDGRGSGDNHFLPTDVTYARLLDTIKKQARWGAPKPAAPTPKEEAPATPTFPDPKDKEAVDAWLYDNSDEMWRGVDAIMKDAVQDEQIINTFKAKNSEWAMENVVGNFVDGWLSERVEEMFNEYPATIKAWFDYGQRGVISNVMAERIAKAIKNPAEAPKEKVVNGYKAGDEVMLERNGKWEKQRIVDFDANDRPILDSFGTSFITEVADWSRIKPADGAIGEAKRVATEAKEKRKQAGKTPLMLQFEAMKEKHPGTLLLFRVGDFFETFKEDAQVVSKVLNLTLTSRAIAKNDKVYLAGFPNHAIDKYLPRLIKAGYKVAICEQIDEPRVKITTKPKPQAEATKADSTHKAGDRVAMAGQEFEIVYVRENGNLNLRGQVNGIENNLIDISPDKVYIPGSADALKYWYGVKLAQAKKAGITAAKVPELRKQVEGMVEKAKERLESDKSFEAVEQMSQALAMEQVLNDIALGKTERKDDATATAVEMLKGGKSKKPAKKKAIKPEQQVGDLFGGLFDEPISTTTDEKKTDVQPRPGSAERERGHQPQPNGALGESQRNEVKGTDGRGMGGRDAVNPLPDGERGAGVSRKPASREPLERLPEAERKNSNNNHAERGTDYAPKGEDARIKANIEAIQLAKQLLEAGEQATPEQMAVLRRFSGWGGLGKAFKDDSPTAHQLLKLLGAEAYETAVMSRNSAYYTPAEVIDTMWDVVRAMGFKGGNVLEGSAGIGNILGLMPADFSERSNIHAIEIDQLTGGILSLLYPDAKVDIQGFEKTKIRNNSVDLAITNVPFVTGLNVMDETGDKDLSKKFRDIHDFCIAKNIRKLREGGIGIFITSSGTMDNSARLRQWITSDGNADVVGAFRMHNKTFGGTGATSDIIVVRKRVNGKPSPNAINIADVTGLRTADYDTGDTRKVAGQEVPIIKSMPMEFNKYFVEHPENMAGEMMFNFERGETWQPTSKSLFPTAGKDQSAMLKEWAGKFADMKPEDEAVSVEDAMTRINERLGEDVKEGSMVLNSKGELCVARMGEAEPIKVNKNKVKGHTKAECFQAYTAIKKALKDVLDYQASHDDDAGLTPLLKELNRAFDSFTRTYGNLHKNTAISFLRNDVDFSSILALETYSEKGDKKGNKVVKVGKTDIFSRRVIENEKEPQPGNIKDGILASLYKSGGVDVEYIADALGKTPDDVRKEIVESGLGFENPATGAMEVSYQYLSGNVRDKLHIAEESNEDGRYDANVKALQRALPMTIPAHLIEFSLGSSWIDHRLYEAFVEEKTGVKVGLTNAGGTWFMKRPWSTFTEKNRAMGVVSKMCGKTIMGDELIEAAITNKTITVSKTERHYDGSTETITDSEATRLCATKVDEIRAEFKDWARARMQTDSNLAETIERTYNEQFNNYVPMAIPEEFVPTHFGGQVSELHGRPFALRPHQSRAVVRAMTQPVLLAHEVGTGKTYTLITTAMEMRRLGTARKPMIVVQNATVGQFVESAKVIYPNAKVLTIEEADRTADGRRNFYAKIKYNDWDMIVVPQSVFERIPDSEEREMAYVKSIIEEKMKVLEAMKEADSQGKSVIVRQAEKDLDDSRARLSELTEALQTKRAKRDAKREAKTKQNAEVKALEMLDREVDDVENFDDMGIDAILVDEAHEYKHLGFATAMQRGVKGVDPSFSKKSQGVYLKAQAVLEHNNGRNVVFATGTPISNTAAEIWTFMRYLMPADTMKAYGIYYFDDFVRNFGNISQMVEFTTSGKFKENNRFAGYINLPELVRIWSSVADTVLTREAGGVSDKIPDIEGGKPTDIYLPQTRALRSIMKYVNEQLKKYDEMTGKEKKENSHIPLVMYGIAKAAAVDARLVLADAPDEPNSKTNATVRETLRSLKDSEKYKGTVAIFADNYQNKQSGFNLYEDIRAKLIDQGVPAEQIVIIKSGMTVKKKLDIFEKVNAGEIRVIMGSTFTLGTGVNIQERLHTLIHVDAPNRPMDYTQRNGRGARQGNLHKDMGIPIRILRFGVEDSLDVTAYQRLKTKGAIADSIMNGSKMMKNSMENRVLEEEEDVFGDMTAQLSGSEYAILKNQAEREVRSLTAKQKQHEVDQIYIHNKLPEVDGFIAGAQRRIEIETANLETIGKHWPDGKIKKITIGKNTFGSLAEMEDFFKEQNAKLAKATEEMKQGGDNYTSTLPINIDGMEFVVTSSVKPKVTGAGQLSLDLERTVSYSCEALGIKDFSPSGQRLKAVMQDIEQYIVTGERSKGLLSRGESQLAKYTEERTQLEARKGNEFPFSKELAEAKSRLAEYEEAMKKEMAEKEAKYAELDKSVEAASDLSLSEEDSEDSDKSMLRPMEEGEPDTEWLESLSDDELVPVFRNVQVLPSLTDLASPMAGKDLITGAYRTIVPRQWNGSYSNVELTEEQQRMYDELAEKGYVMIDGKKRTRFDISPERYFEARATKAPALMFKLDKGVDGIVPASENPYDHAKFNTLNLQFSTGHKRPNLVMVQSVMPKSELRKMMANDEIAEGMYHAPFAKNSTGIVSWTNGDKLALSRWSKIIRVLTNQEVAERINSYWQKNPSKSPAESADARDPFNYTPQVLERLQEMGWKFDEEKLARLASRTPEEIEASYQGMPYVTDEDIARLNAKYADERHSSLWDKEPDEFLREAEENTMADKVQQMSERMNTPVRILRTPEEIQAYARNPREAKAKGISRIERGGSRVAEIAILLPNNTDLADVENTFLHEGMGHDGLRLLFPTEKLLNNALDELYNASTDAIKADIDARAKRIYDAEVDRIFREKQAAHESVADANANYYTDMAEAHAEANAKREQMKRDATEEYGANVAGKVGEKGFEKMTAEEQTFWGKMKAMLQKAFEALLRGLKIPKMRKWTDKQWAYIYHKAYKMKKANGRMSVIEEAEDITMRRKTGYDADERTMFRDPDMSLEETITKMKAEIMQANTDNLQAKRDAMRAIGGNLNHLRQAMARQREYDITTVKSVTDLAKILMDAGLLDDMSKFETKRILGAVNNVVGRQDVSQYVQKVMDIMVDNQLRNGAGAFGKLLAIRGSRVDARGIEVQGELDPDGQRIAQVVRKSTSLPKDDIDNRIAEAINRMSSTDQAIADEATLEYAGLQIARQYVEDITESKAEEKALRDSIKQAKEDKDAGQMTDDAYKQYVESTNDAIRQNKIERAEAYQSLIEQMGDALSASVERAKAWREAEKQRVEEIHHNANSDMEGRPTDEHHKDDRVQKLSNNSFVRFMLAPLGTFDQMLRMFGKKNVRGEGYLWNRYMRGWVEAAEKEYTGYRDALKVLDAKVSEIYGKKMTWGDLFAIDRKLPKASVRFWDGGEMKDHELTQGNLLYIYMADKMSDGRMKLRRMGITEDDIENIKDFLDPKFIQLADWMQEEFLVGKRNEYNEVHKRMFGASMAAIENYFPLKILANARLENVDVADDTTDTALPATSTGSIIKRRRNNLALDVTGANAFSVILDHLQQMERWAAFAEFNRDLNTLLSYKRFRNQVMNMSSVFGGGKTLWTNFRNVCSMAAGAYRPPIAALDKAAVNIAKGVTAAKVSFRVFTALKQFLSMPAYLSDSNPLYLAANIANPYGAWKWSMENLPLFEKRWRSRMAGDPRLLKSDMDWKMWRSRVVEIASRIGMSPNAFVDALTVAIGSHAMYQSRLAGYKRKGYDLDVAEERAKQDATILFNQTQQSSEGAFLSTMQVDRSWLSVLFTVFRNSSMSYTRQLYDSLRSLKRYMTPGNKALSVEFMAKQMWRDGIDPDKADRNAKREYRRNIIRDLARVAVFGFALQLAWNMGAYLPYLLMGDDESEKDKMWDDILNHTYFGSIEGLTGGDVMSSAGQMWLNGEGNWEYLAKDMPLASDLATILRKMPNDQKAAVNDILNLLVQSGVGVNPQSLTDIVVATMDYFGDDAQTSREFGLLMARIINCPQSQIDKLYFDELGASAEEASKMTPSQIAERYARYKIRRGAPLTGWAYGSEEREQIMEKYRKRSNTLAKERLTRVTDKAVSDSLKTWDEEYKTTKDRVSAIRKVSERDEDRYYEMLDELEATPEFDRYQIITDYKRDVDELTKEWLRAKTPEQRDSCAKAIVNLKRLMITDLRNTQQ